MSGVLELWTGCEVCGLANVGEHFDQIGEWCDGAGARKASDAEVLAYAATLDGAEVHRVSIGDDGELVVHPVLLLDEGKSYLVVPLPDKETTDE